MPVMEGKAALFKRFAGVDSIPLVLDTQDTEEIIQTVKFLPQPLGELTWKISALLVVLKLNSV